MKENIKNLLLNLQVQLVLTPEWKHDTMKGNAELMLCFLYSTYLDTEGG